jgi:hypothetical protein
MGCRGQTGRKLMRRQDERIEEDGVSCGRQGGEMGREGLDIGVVVGGGRLLMRENDRVGM